LKRSKSRNDVGGSKDSSGFLKGSIDSQQLIRQPSAHTPKAFRSTAQGCPTFCRATLGGVHQKFPTNPEGVPQAFPDNIMGIDFKTVTWVKEELTNLRGFYWQNGYGAFSISPSHVAALQRYIANQEEHHRRESFQDEFRRLLRKYGVEFDERYVWD
jgi:hypothetical protein